MPQTPDFDITPQSRDEDILVSIIEGTEYTEPAESRIEYRLIQLKEVIEGGSGDYATAISLSLNTQTYVMTAQLLNKDGEAIGEAQTIDLPLESTVVSGSYDNQTKSLILTLVSGDTVTIPIGDLITGLISDTDYATTSKAGIVKPDGVTGSYEGSSSGYNATLAVDGTIFVYNNNNMYLTSISIPYGVETVGEYAFETCTYLAHVIIPGSVRQ